VAAATAALVSAWLAPGSPLRAGASSCPAAPAACAGSQGTDVSLPATDSAVTVTVGSGTFQGLQVTVDQTRDLVNQAVSISWTGAPATFSNPTTDTFQSTFAGDYLQIFQCWGDPETATGPLSPEGPGPPPSQCEFGAESPTPTSVYPISEVGYEYSRVLTQPTWSTDGQMSGPTYEPEPALAPYTDATNGNLVIEPFHAVDGTTVDEQADYNYDSDPLHPTAFWQNPYFSFDTTNEVDFARSSPSSAGGAGGQQLFQVDTGLEAPGLGCGQSIQPLPDSSTKIPQCWLVIVPRGTPAQENPAGAGADSVVTSPLAPSAWQNRIAIPLGFDPVGSSCAIGADEVRIVGSELATSAVSSWQPVLCAQPGAPPYNYSYTSDDQARQNLLDSSYGGAGMSVFSEPIDPSVTTASNPVVYAPLTLSGVVIGFNVDRSPALMSDGQSNPNEQALSGVRVTHLYLTPRLVAKLLTESYRAQLEDVNATDPGYSWILHNPTSLVTDPDFLQCNPEFSLLTTQQQTDAGTLLVEESSSDAAAALWQWVLSDPAARKWLNGQPDPWGMVVNPYYDMNAALNPSGVGFGSPVPNSFPKNDPYQLNTGDTVGSPPAPARPIGVLDWSPYALTMQDAAQSAGAANDGAKTTLNPDATPDTAWTANGPQKVGTQFILTVTDSASAAQYGLQTASLSRSGDDGPDPTFIAPTTASVLAGEQAMTPSPAPGVLQANPATTAVGAYPLPMLTYAATSPVSLDAAARTDYANFIEYAAGPGQTAGDEQGQLPAGYVPLPQALRTQALSAASTILNPPVPATSPPAPVSPAEQSTTAVPTSSGGDVSVEPTSTVLPRAALSTQRTETVGVGAAQLVLPLGLIVGVVALIGALLVGFARRKPSPALDASDTEKPVFEPW
jgi:hypothetical protein